MKQLHVASINRSGASLLTRLLDGHPDVASYPIEFNFPQTKRFFPFIDKLTGTPTEVPAFDPAKDRDLLRYFGIPETQPKPEFKWGKEKADPIGVRKNYLEREVYGAVKTDFDYEKFIARLKELGAKANTVSDAYEARHRAYFEAWESGRCGGTLSYIATYGSGELFLSNLDTYFKEFKDSFILTPVRDVFGYVASEKTRYARRYCGSKRFTTIKMPNSFVKSFRRYDLEALVRSWQVALTRTVLLQEKFGIDGRYLVLRYENLVRDPKTAMSALCRLTGLRYDESLLQPTIGGRPWGGSSHQGRQSGINAELTDYYPQVLAPDEIRFIEESCGRSMEALKKITATPADLRAIPKEALYDYATQKKYSTDEEKWALYSALAFRDRRRVQVGPPDSTAFTALTWGLGVRLASIPRLWRQRLFPGWGRQNYT